jgi:hypothetical protein
VSFIMIRKIISGGQIGAEQAALDVAIKLGISHGGWIQKGRRTQRWILPDKYKLNEMPTASYKDRIEKNVTDSEGTVIISHGRLTGGSDYSYKMAKKHNRPCLHMDLKETPVRVAAAKVNSWILENDIEVLNVAGAKASEDSKIYDDTLSVIEGAILLGLEKAAAGKQLTVPEHNEYFKKMRVPPKSVHDAVELLVQIIPLQNRIKIANLEKEDLESLYLALGAFVRNQIFNKGVHTELFDSCRSVSENEQLNEFKASFIIIEKLWEALRKTHKLRVIK